VADPEDRAEGGGATGVWDAVDTVKSHVLHFEENTLKTQNVRSFKTTQSIRRE